MNNVLKIKTGHTCFLILILVFSACTGRFGEFNTNPVEATEDMLKKDNLNIGGFIPQMQKNVIPVEVHHYQRSQNLIGDIYSGYLGATGNWNSGRNNTTYALIDEWTTRLFTTAFTNVMPAWKQIQIRVEETNPSVFAVAQILKIAALHRTTDCYGPLPYSGFGKSGLTTAYDSQEAIYKSFFEELTSATTVLKRFVSQTPEAKPLKNFDLVYGGDYSKWIKFANSLRLRLAMRVVYIDGELAKTNAEAAVNDIHGVITENSDNAFLKSANGIRIINPLKEIWDNYNDTRMGANMESFLVGYGDPRIEKYYRVNEDDQYKGVRNGINLQYNLNSYRGRKFSAPNIEADTPMKWMTASEMYFLRSEGALRGWNMGGRAKDLYEMGIETSFAQWEAGNADTYKNNSDSLPAAYYDPADLTGRNAIPTGDSRLSTIKIAWDETDSFERKLERIITQKWIAGYPDGQEAWTEFRRTGYPRVFPVVDNFSDGTIDTDIQIRRIPFPVGEYQTNAENMDKAVELLNGPDTGGTKLWWDKKSEN